MVEGLISSVNLEGSVTVGKNPIQFKGQWEKEEEEKEDEDRNRDTKAKPLWWKECCGIFKFWPSIHFLFLLVMFCFYIDRNWVPIFRLNWVFPTKDLSHCNHRPFLPTFSKKDLIYLMTNCVIWTSKHKHMWYCIHLSISFLLFIFYNLHAIQKYT
jgi:hypothetical protein